MGGCRNTRIVPRETPGFLKHAGWVAGALNSNDVHMPVNGTDNVLINSGRAFVEKTGPMSKEFARHGIAPEDVSATVEALETSSAGYAKASAERSAAIKEFDKLIAEAMATVRRLDALVGQTLKHNAGAMTAYAIARTVSRTKARRTASIDPVPSSTPPAPAAKADGAAA